MELVKIYGRDLEPVGECGDFTRLEYSKEFREAGTAELTLPVTSGAATVFVPDGYISVPDGGTMYIIRSVERDMRGGEVRVRCEGLLSLFRGTVIPQEFSLYGSVTSLLHALVRKGTANLPATLSISDVTVEKKVELASGRSVLYNDMLSLCYLGKIGMSLEYSGGRLVFSARTVRDRTDASDDPVLVSGRLGILDAERVVLDLSAYRNVAVVSGAEKESGGRYTVTVRSDGLDISDGFDDTEYFDRQLLVRFGAPLSDYMTEDSEGKSVLDESKYTAAMRLAGAAALGRCRPRIYLYCNGSSDGFGIQAGDMVRISDGTGGFGGTAVAERVVTVYSERGYTVRTELRADAIQQ